MSQDDLGFAGWLGKAVKLHIVNSRTELRGTLKAVKAGYGFWIDDGGLNPYFVTWHSVERVHLDPKQGP
jgi:hypothetical protein